VLNSSKRHTTTLNPGKLTAEHTKNKLLKTRVGKVGSWPDAEPVSTSTQGILTAPLQRPSKQQVTRLGLYQQDKDRPQKNIKARLREIRARG